MSINWQSADPAPRLLVLPRAAASLDEAHAAIELWEHYKKRRLDLTQRLAVEVMMAQRADGKWAAATTGREMCRQQGKGDEIEVVELWGLVQRGEAIMHTVHDAVLLASQTQQRMLAVLEAHGDLRRRKKREWLGTGQQMIEMHNGGIIWYRTRTGGGGRGVDDVDRLVVDEAQHAQEEHLAAVTPTLFANDNPQMNAMGTAGIAGKSAWWWQVRIRALSPDPGDLGYVGHTAENVYLDKAGKVVQDPVDVNDMSLVPEANPALHSGRGQPIEFFHEQLRRLGPKSYAREHLGVWDPPPAERDAAEWQFVSEQAWTSHADPKAERGKSAVFGVDIGEDRLAHVGVAWKRPDGGVQVMVADTNLSPLATPDRLKKLTEKWKAPVVLGGPSAALEDELRRSRTCNGTEFAEACGKFDDLLRADELWHGNQPDLNDAVKAALWRHYGSAGGQALQLRDAPLVGPLAAVIRALHGLFAAKPAPAKPKVERRVPSRDPHERDISTMQF